MPRAIGCPKSERGQVLVIAALSLTVLIGCVSLAIDVGYLQHMKRLMQAAADAAAIAGASELPFGSPTAAARRDAALNGFTNGTGGVTVAVRNPPTAGPYVGNNNYVEVVVSQPQQMFFMRVLGFNSVPINTRAVAPSASSPNCIYGLDPTMSGSLHTDGGNALTSSCGVIVDSSSSTAITNSGSITAPTVGIVGNYSGNAPVATKISTGLTAVDDPLAYVPAPSVGACGAVPNGSAVQYTKTSGTATLNPGVYCGGIAVSGTAIVTLNAGMYILKGGGLDVHGTGRLNGTGVTFYNTGTSSTYKPIYTQDQSVMVLKAPTSGTYAGILFFQDRSISSSAENIIGVDGGGAGIGALEGALYFPTTPLVLSSGQNQSVAYTIIVAKSINLAVNTFVVHNDYSSLDNGSPIKATMLAE